MIVHITLGETEVLSLEMVVVRLHICPDGPERGFSPPVSAVPSHPMLWTKTKPAQMLNLRVP